MAQHLPSFPRFEPHDSGDISTRWRKWVSKFRNLMVALDINNDARQKALLLHYVGDETNDIFDTLTVEVAADGETNTDKAIQTLTNHFEPKQNIEFAIYKFRQAQQNKEEDFSSFLTRLRQLAVNCNFTETERELKTQIIQGCASSRLRRKALSEPSMTLEKLIETARASETANIQASGMEVKTGGEHVATKGDHEKQQAFCKLQKL